MNTDTTPAPHGHMNRPFLVVNQMGGGSEDGLEGDCSVQRHFEQHVLLELLGESSLSIGEADSSEAGREPLVKLQSDRMATSTGLEGGCGMDEHTHLPNVEDFLGVEDHTQEGVLFSEAEREAFCKLQSDYPAISTLESTDGSESNDSTALTLGVVTMENIQDVGKTESGFEQDSKSMANLRSFDILDRSWNIARSPQSRLDQRIHDLNLGLAPADSKFCERISRQNKLLHERTQNIYEKREKLRRYRPGDWLVEAGGVGRTGFAIPKVTTLLVVGPSGSGKSTLINNMIRVLNNKTCGYDRAQVYEEEANGSYFMQEYVVCEDAKNISVFDSRGLSENHGAEDLANIRTWMTDGICHGEAVCRESDSKIVREALEGRGRQGHSQWSTKRKVNFVIFVVNAVSVHMMKKNGDVVSKENLAMLYKSPFLSFKDDRPAVVMTHGDQLSPSERIDTRIFIGEIFGVSPVDQVFDISCFTGRFVNCGDETPVDDLVLLDMLDFALERSDRNLPYKHPVALYFGNACAGIMEHFNKLDRSLKTAWIAIFLTWFFCLALLIIVKCARHRQDMHLSTRYFGAEGLLRWRKKRYFG